MTSPVDHWTEARYWAFIRSALRRAWSKYPNKFKVKNAARRTAVGKKGNQKWEYQCASCGGWFAGKNVSVDHIEPAGSLRSYSDLPAFVSKLFCGVDNLQVICFSCHAEKTNAERGIIPEVSEFKKAKAEEQKRILKKKGLRSGKNAKERLEILMESIEEKK
jgi:5-methylcytosine-specific restriction endonuclease McrA